MRKNIDQLISWLLCLITLIIIISVGLFINQQRNSQGNNFRSLEERLIQLGIPVKSITVIKQSPLEIEIVLLSSSIDKQLNRDDIWYKFLTEREVELAYLNFGTKIENYRIIVLTNNGNSIYDSTVFLYPDLPSQKLTQAPPSSIDNNKVKDILERNLSLQGLILLSLNVPSNYTDQNNSKIIILDLSLGAVFDQLNIEEINNFIINLRPQIEDINSQYSTNIIIIHALIKDSNNNLLVDYMEDIELGRQSSWVAENIEGSWYPLPAPTIIYNPIETSIPVVSPTAIPTTSLITPTLLPTAYPPPSTPNPYP